MQQREMSFSIDEGNAFFAHEVSLNFTPLHFYMDFKSVTPRLDVRSKAGPFIHMKHNVIMLDPFHVKEMHRLLGDVLKRYEEEFGKINKPSQLKKLDAKRKSKSSNNSSAANKESEDNNPNYFG